MPETKVNPRKAVSHANVVKIDKAIVTNLSALKRKYGAAGVKKIEAAIKNLIAKDHKRGLVTRLYFLDDAAAMKRVNGKPVTKAIDPKQNKNAIDAVYKALAPDYLMILCSIDVVPHQNLKNPLYAPYDDPDKFAFGDLPYACEAKYSQRPQNFFGPTRVVGRLPDITGAKDPQYLVALLKTAAAYRNNSNAQSYRNYFGISAEVWKQTTDLSLSATFGNATDMKTVPPSNAKWPAAQVKQLFHFINCHGAPDDSHFYGQPRSGAQDYPVALDAAYMEKKISEGTVAAAECCYGGQLFDPAYNRGQMGISNTYLANKAYGFFGSTTIAYGPDDHNDQADLICQYFLQSLLKGASIGRAALEARQKFVHSASMSDPSNVKTIAQFNLYADPSIAPIQLSQAPVGKVKTIAAPVRADLRMERAERRRDLFSRGLALATSQPIISRFDYQLPGKIALTLEKKAAEYRIPVGRTLTFSVMEPPTAKFMPVSLMEKELFPTRVHVIFQATGQGRAKTTKEATNTAAPAVVGTVALIVNEVDGTIASVKKIFSR